MSRDSSLCDQGNMCVGCGDIADAITGVTGEWYD
jgi:hypothetical protein